MGTKPNSLNHARAFLKMLDPKAERFCFRTFGDRSTVATPSLAGNFQGDFQQVCQRLQTRNEQGAGVFVVINEGGQKKGDITRVRAVFADTDGADSEPIISALPPHIVVNTSPGKWHVYWLVTDDFPVDQFRAVQLAIAERFGTDKKVADLPHVMRLPGFYHNKAEPYPVTISEWNATIGRYHLDEIVSGLGLSFSTSVMPPLLPTTAKPARHKSEIWRKVLTGQYTKSEIEEMLTFINPACNRREWMDIIFAIAFELGEEGRELADRWSRGDLWNGAAQ